jgi:hypothetical protein
LEHGHDLAEGPTPNQLKEFEDCSNSLLQELHDRIDNLLHGFAPADQQAVIDILTRAGRFVVADGAFVVAGWPRALAQTSGSQGFKPEGGI